MANDTAELFRRFNKIERENGYRIMRRKELAENIVTSIAAIPDKNFELVQKYVPEIAQLRELTVESLMANQNNEYELVQRVVKKLYTLADDWIRHFEEALC